MEHGVSGRDAVVTGNARHRALLLAAIVVVALAFAPRAEGFLTGEREAYGSRLIGPTPHVFSLGAVNRNERTGTGTLTVTVGQRGEVELTGTNKVTNQVRYVNDREGGTTRLALRPRGRALEKLYDTGEVKFNAEVTYRPDVGVPETKSKVVKLIRDR